MKINNIGMNKSPSFTVGFGINKQAKINSSNNWLGKITVPGVFAGQHINVIIPWQTQTIGDPTLVAAVDIDGVVDETNELNNFTKPFSYLVPSASVLTPPPLPASEPFEAFNVIKPEQGNSFPTGSDVRIDWYPTKKLLGISSNEESEFWELEILLVDNSTG